MGDDGAGNDITAIGSNGNNSSLIFRTQGVDRGKFNSTGDLLLSNRLGVIAVPDATTKYAITLPNDINTGYGRAFNWEVYSDSRIKTSQAPIQYGLADLMKLQPKTYIQHTGGVKDGVVTLGEGAETIGLIAQEVYGVIPEAVSKPDDPNNSLWGISYDKLTPVIIKAIQELASQNLAVLARLDNFTASSSINSLVDQRLSTLISAGQINTASSTFWSFDSSTGQLKANQPLDLNNFDLNNIRAITSVSGTWSLDPAGTLHVPKIETKDLYVENGITTKDHTTGQTYCLYIDNGQMKSVPGSCQAFASSTDSTIINTPISPPATSTSSSSTTSTLTPPVLDMGTSTAPVPPAPVLSPETSPIPVTDPTASSSNPSP
jgi:hypothetical protein